jgi:hypothetical protein
MLVALARHRQHPLNQGAVLWVLQSRVAEERVKGCQAGVPASNRVVAIPFKMIEESAQKRCVQVLQPEFRWCLPKAFLREAWLHRVQERCAPCPKAGREKVAHPV